MSANGSRLIAKKVTEAVQILTDRLVLASPASYTFDDVDRLRADMHKVVSSIVDAAALTALQHEHRIKEPV